ncbi:MAG: hypothetical protein JSR62_03640 [Nitrospira sp.]|nr:hypothetical protein [Nitrospira sp.]
MSYPTQFTRYTIGSDKPQEEIGQRNNRYIGPESGWKDHGFNSMEECQAAFQSELYQVDEEYRLAVQIMLANSPEFAPGNAGSGIEIGNGVLERKMANTDAARQAEDAACWNEYVQNLFNDPRYHTSPIYRREVRELIAKHEAEFNGSPLASRVVDRTGQAMRIELTSDAIAETREQLKAEHKADAKAQAQAAARSAARQAYFSALGTNDPGESGPDGISNQTLFGSTSPTPQPESEE